MALEQQGHDELYTLDLVSRGLKIVQEFSNGKRTRGEMASDLGELRTEIREMIPNQHKAKYGNQGPQGGTLVAPETP